MLSSELRELPVEVPLEIEQVRFDAEFRSRVPESGSKTDIQQGAMDSAIILDVSAGTDRRKEE